MEAEREGFLLSGPQAGHSPVRPAARRPGHAHADARRAARGCRSGDRAAQGASGRSSRRRPHQRSERTRDSQASHSKARRGGLMRIAVCHPQTPFVRGGAETHAEQLMGALRDARHETDLVLVAGKWYPGAELIHQMAVWRSMELSESNGLPIDVVIPLKFPAYLIQHERKVVWLIHQHRTAYELWDHPDYADLARQKDAVLVRDAIHAADRVALGEAKRVFTNSKNVQRRLWDSLRIPSEPLYHRSPLTADLLLREPGPYGDAIVF